MTAQRMEQGPEPFSVKSAQQGEVLHVGVVGELDQLTAPILDIAVVEALVGKCPAIVIDLEDVSFLAVSGVRSLLRAAGAAAGIGRVLTVVNPQPASRRLLQLTGADKILGLTDETAAIRSLIEEKAVRMHSRTRANWVR